MMMMMIMVANQSPHYFCDSFTVSRKQHRVSRSSGITLRRTAVPSERAKELHVVTPNSSSSATKRKGSTKSTGLPNATTTKQKRDGRKKMSTKEEYYFYDSMMNHELLTKAQEIKLTTSYHTAKELQKQIDTILLQKQQDLVTAIDDRENFVLNELGMNDFENTDDDDDDDVDQWDERYLYSGSRDSPDTRTRRKTASTSRYTLYSDEDSNSESVNNELLLERFHQSSRTTMASLLLDPSNTMDDDDDDDDSYNYDDSVDGNFLFDSFTTTKGQRRNYADPRLSSLSISLLTEQDIVERLHIPGGRQEMEHILLNGAQARDTLIRCNLRLVQSISKKWARLTYGQKGGGSASYDLYSGSWDRPSLREAIQEGVMGLTTAVEKFDPARGVRFSTYATHWIINSVRQCFQRSSTGCLKLPTAYYDTRTRFRTLVRQYYDMDGYVPSIDSLAAEMGFSKRRLQLTLRLTRPLLSLDARTTTFTRPGQSGSISGVETSQISDAIADNSFGNNPMDRVELSFLRQQLEHAMAIELIPFERDVLRLRLGLDDGVVRTCREVAVMCGGRLKWTAIYNVEKRALRKLRSPMALATYKFLSFLDFADVDMKTITLK